MAGAPGAIPGGRQTALELGDRAEGGGALGRFSAALIDGSFPSYATLLEAAAATDPMRVVDGEVDNVWTPAKATIVLR